MRRVFWTIFVVVLFTALGAPMALRADDIQYTVAQSLPDGGITGTITTDGTLGSLAPGDIVDWDLTITSFSSSEVLTPSNSTVVTGTVDGLSATTTELTSDFTDASDGADFLQFIATSPGLGYASWVDGYVPDTYGYIAANATSDNPPDETLEYVYSPQVIAADGTPVPTPEPGTSSLMLVGMGLLGLVMVRRKHMGTVHQQAT
jgi:hypothetical protein